MAGRIRRRGKRILVGVALCGQALCWAPAAMGQSAWGENLIQNPSFEEGEKWPTGWKERSAYRMGGELDIVDMLVDYDVYRSGKRALQLSGTSFTTSWFSVESAPVPVKPGRRYLFMGWIKTKDVRPEGKQVHHCNLHARFTTADGTIIGVHGMRLAVTKSVLGTTGWQRFQKMVTAPVGAEFVRIGCVLTCAGWAWFDDIALHEQVDLNWQKVETDRFLFFYEGKDAPTREQMDAEEEHLARVEKLLDMKHKGKINYYKYSSRERKREITGIGKTVHYDERGIHGTRWNDKHEMVHVVMQPLGDSSMLLREGIAVYLEWKWRDMDLHDYTRQQGKEMTLPSLYKLIDDVEFAETGKDLTLSVAGSFVGYLIEEYGIDKFKKIYSLAQPHGEPEVFLRKFNSVYGRDLEDIEALWRTKIAPER